MAKCPECKKEIAKPSKKWKYGQFTVELFECVCGTKVRHYFRSGKYSFTLKFKKGKDQRYTKV